MQRASKVVVAAMLGLGAAGGWIAAMPATGWAQQPPGGPPSERERPLPGRHIEGRIAFLKAELKITPPQEAMWERVAAAMRSNAGQIDQFMLSAKPDEPPASAMERLDRRAQFTALHAASAQAMAAAFKPLYAAMTDEQKQAADELVARPMHRGMHQHHDHPMR